MRRFWPRPETQDGQQLRLTVMKRQQLVAAVGAGEEEEEEGEGDGAGVAAPLRVHDSLAMPPLAVGYLLKRSTRGAWQVGGLCVVSLAAVCGSEVLATPGPCLHRPAAAAVRRCRSAGSS